MFFLPVEPVGLRNCFLDVLVVFDQPVERSHPAAVVVAMEKWLDHAVLDRLLETLQRDPLLDPGEDFFAPRLGELFDLRELTSVPVPDVRVFLGAHARLSRYRIEQGKIRGFFRALHGRRSRREW